MSIFETGAMLEPFTTLEQYGPKVSYGAQPRRKTGTVHFDNTKKGAGRQTILTVFAHPSIVEENTTLVQIDTIAGGRYKIVLNEAILFNGDVESDNPNGDTE